MRLCHAPDFVLVRISKTLANRNEKRAVNLNEIYEVTVWVVRATELR